MPTKLAYKARKPNVIMQPYHVDIVFAFHGHWTKSFFGE